MDNPTTRLGGCRVGLAGRLVTSAIDSVIDFAGGAVCSNDVRGPQNS